MPVMNFDLEDGLDPVSFTLKREDAERFMDFMQDCHDLEQTLDDLRRHSSEVEDDRDALMAHVERLREALRLAKINLAYSEDGFAPQYRNICRKALEATPQASLAHLKAEWQAEALENLAAEFREAWPHHNGKHAWIIGAGVQIRRQAEEPAA